MAETKPQVEDIAFIPDVGDVVLYFAYGTPGGEFPAGVARAAIITEVNEPQPASPNSKVGLCVLNPTGLFFNRDVPRGHFPGGWDWPTFRVTYAQKGEQEDGG